MFRSKSYKLQSLKIKVRLFFIRQQFEFLIRKYIEHFIFCFLREMVAETFIFTEALSQCLLISFPLLCTPQLL